MTRKAAWIGGLVAAAVLGGVITVAYVVDYTDGERPGVAFAGIDTFDSAHDANVKLPIGTLKVQLGTPSQDFDVDFRKTKRAADGAVIVPVGWELDGAEAGIENTTPTYQFQLTLVAGGRRYDLQAGREDDDDSSSSSSSQPIVTSGRVAAVVEGDGEDLDVEVEYDGLTQVLHVDSGKIDSGIAAPYYAPGGLTQLTAVKGCTAVSEADEKAYVVTLNKCSLGPVTLTPYVGGFGWVGSETESWAAVPYSLQVGGIDARGGNGRYSTELRRFDVTLDGAKPTADILRYRHRGSVIIGGYKIFRTSTTPTTLGLTTELLGDSRFNGSGTRTFRTSQTSPLR